MAALTTLVLFRVAFSLAVLAGSPGRILPAFPRYRYNPLEGDAYGYYYCVRELLAVWQRDIRIVAPVVVLAVGGAVAVFRFSQRRVLWAAAVVWAAGAIAAVLAERVRFTGAAQVGWPLVWSIPLLPLRALGGSVRPDVAYGFGLALSLACNALIVGAAYVLGRSIGLRARVAVLGAALIAFWPVLSLLAGSKGAGNGTWQIDLGLSLYTEPLSTALVLVSLVRIVRGSRSETAALMTGALLGLAVLVRLSNILILACALVFLFAWRERRSAVALATGALAFAPAAILFWPKSYPMLKAPVFPAHPFALAYVPHAWSNSLLWHPAVLAVLLPLALLGTLSSSRRAAALLWSCVAATAAFYSFYSLTPIHPRFLFVILPVVLVFWAAGAALVIRSARSRLGRWGPDVPSS